MEPNNTPRGFLARIETYLDMADAGQKIQLNVHLHKDFIKQAAPTDESDDLIVIKDIYLLMADYRPFGGGRSVPIVSKIYAFGSINDSEVDAKTIRSIANERLKLDYRRLTERGIQLQVAFFE